MKKNSLYFISGIVFLIAVWVCFYLIIGNDYIVPSPIKALENTFILLTEGYFYQALFSTLLRVVIAFLISLILAIFTAILSYKFNAFSTVLSVVNGALRSLPILAVLLIILVSVSRTTAPIIVCFLTLYPMFYTAIFSSLKGVDKGVTDMVKVYKIPVKKQVFKVYLPTILPKVILDFSTAFSFAIKLTVSAEILANVYGSLGGVFEQASLYSDAVMLFALTIAVTILGIIVEFIGKIAFDYIGRKRV
ncbi:MAG: ABC transporter permease subunit [Clostridiales bacterium]|nr:ABC transporter permease subunit [Clostridiales bacterium]